MSYLFAAVLSGPNTGMLSGHIDVGPLTPVERPGSKPVVPPEYYKPLLVEIWLAKGKSVQVHKTATVSGTGDFKLELAPGDYTVRVTSKQPNPIARMPEARVKIRRGATTRIEMKIDTGIRLPGAL